MDNGESSYRRFLEGDNGAFAEIVEAYKDSLIFFINRYVHNFAVAEELAQDVSLLETTNLVEIRTLSQQGQADGTLVSKDIQQIAEQIV